MPTQMLFERIPEDLFPVLALGVLGLTAVLIAVPTVLAYQWRMRRVAQAHVDLKREMVQRGMSAGEIERVIRTTSIPELVQQGLSTKAIDRLLRSNGGPGTAGDSAAEDAVTSGRRPAKAAALDPEI